MKRRSLAFRLLLANLIVVVIGAAALFVTARLLGPSLFDSEMTRIGQRYGWSQGGGPGRGDGAGPQANSIEEDLSDAFAGSLTVALLVAIGIGALASAGAAVVVSRRVVRPIDRMGDAVRDMAGGNYDHRVDEPSDRELAGLARDVNALGSALAASEERRADLVSDLSHELRTPITALDGFLEGLEDGVFEPEPEILAAMRSETRRMQRLTADLGNLSKTAEATFDLQRRPADLASVIAAASNGLMGAARSAQVDLEVADGPELPASIDVDRMGQVFTNLIGNAIRHTPPGGTVTVAGRSSGGTIEVTVSDTGEGIAPEHLDRIFDRFYRVDQAAPRSGGAGIGLTIARGIARAHGGDIAAASDGAGTGAVFTVTLPRTP